MATVEIVALTPLLSSIYLEPSTSGNQTWVTDPDAGSPGSFARQQPRLGARRGIRVRDSE